jgi:23S rRNA pseudouridine2605 synthase
MQKKKSGKTEVPEHLDGMRLNRFLSRAGRGSRRACDAFVTNGLVTVNGSIIRTPAHRLSRGDRVRYMDEALSIEPSFVIMLNKPVGYETTMSPKRTIRTIPELLNGTPEGAAPVGRLDVRTGGLLLLSNDGELVHRLTHPKWGVEREYLLILSRNPSEKALERLRKGVRTEPGHFSRPASVVICGPQQLRLVLTTGRNREVRKLAMVCRLFLSGLERIRFGPVRIGSLKRGTWRVLDRKELLELYRSVDLETGEF